MVGALAATLIAAGLAVAASACGGGEKAPTQAMAKRASPQSDSSASESASLSAPEGPLMNGDHAIIQQQAVGPLRVGAWRRPVMSFVYAISARAGRDSEDIIVVHGLGKDTVTLTFDNDTLRRIFVNHIGPHTADGIGVGTPFTSVAQRPGASTTVRGAARIVTINKLCGVEFATDSLALSPDSAASSKARAATTVRAISVGYCKQ
ncbi:MAG TPA: hypothetical protein VIG47_11430 [Gemmatimonadaceae bacterium]